jgi:hypothetical protein
MLLISDFVADPGARLIGPRQMTEFVEVHLNHTLIVIPYLQ